MGLPVSRARVGVGTGLQVGQQLCPATRRLNYGTVRREHPRCFCPAVPTPRPLESLSPARPLLPLLPTPMLLKVPRQLELGSQASLCSSRDVRTQAEMIWDSLSSTDTSYPSSSFLWLLQAPRLFPSAQEPPEGTYSPLYPREAAWKSPGVANEAPTAAVWGWEGQGCSVTIMGGRWRESKASV